jgi:hypothetical protein
VSLNQLNDFLVYSGLPATGHFPTTWHFANAGDTLASIKKLRETTVVTFYDVETIIPQEPLAYMYGIGVVPDNSSVFVLDIDFSIERSALTHLIASVGCPIFSAKAKSTRVNTGYHINISDIIDSRIKTDPIPDISDFITTLHKCLIRIQSH